MDRILKHNFNFGLNLPRNKFCDANMRAKDSTRLIPIHRVILAAVSKKFEKMFEEKPGTDTTYMISEVKFETLNKIVEYLYTGQAIFANDGDFWVGLVLLSINLGEVEVENIKTKVETKPVMEEYFEMDTEGCQLKSEIKECCEELVTSSSSLELTNVDPCHFSGLPAATGPNSSISIHAENLGQANQVDGGKSPFCSNSLMINVEDVLVSDTTTEEDMDREVVVQQAAVEEKMKEMSSSEVATYNSMIGGSNVTFTNEKEDLNLKMNNSIDARKNNDLLIHKVQLEDKNIENIPNRINDKKLLKKLNMSEIISSKEKHFTSRRVFIFDSKGVKQDEAKKSPGWSPVTYQTDCGGITGSEEYTQKFCSSGSVSNVDQTNTRNNPARVRMNTKTSIVIEKTSTQLEVIDNEALPVKKYQCKLCVHQYVGDDDLRKHLLNKHTDRFKAVPLLEAWEKAFECVYCNKRTKMKTFHMRHLKKDHRIITLDLIKSEEDWKKGVIGFMDFCLEREKSLDCRLQSTAWESNLETVERSSRPRVKLHSRSEKSPVRSPDAKNYVPVPDTSDGDHVLETISDDSFDSLDFILADVSKEDIPDEILPKAPITLVNDDTNGDKVIETDIVKALVRINTNTSIVIDNNDIQNTDQEKSSNSIYGPKTLVEKCYETLNIPMDKVNMTKNMESNQVKFQRKRRFSDNNDNLEHPNKKFFDSTFKFSCPIQDHSESKCGATECKGGLGGRGNEYLLTTMENQESVQPKTPQLSKLGTEIIASPDGNRIKVPTKVGLKVYPCTHKHGGCKEVFPLKNKLHKHAQKCKHRPNTSFSCRQAGCTKRFYYKKDYDKHVAKFHPPSLSLGSSSFSKNKTQQAPKRTTELSDQNQKLEKS